MEILSCNFGLIGLCCPGEELQSGVRVICRLMCRPLSCGFGDGVCGLECSGLHNDGQVMMFNRLMVKRLLTVKRSSGTRGACQVAALSWGLGGWVCDLGFRGLNLWVVDSGFGFMVSGFGSVVCGFEVFLVVWVCGVGFGSTQCRSDDDGQNVDGQKVVRDAGGRARCQPCLAVSGFGFVVWG